MKNQRLITFLFIFINIINSFYPQTIVFAMESKSNNDITIVDKSKEEKNDKLDISIIMPQIKGLGNKEKENEINEEIESYTDKWLKEIVDAANEFYKGDEHPFAPYAAYVRYSAENKQDPVSFYIDYYQFTGGAHGITVRKPYNIDRESGKKLTLQDLFKPGYDYKSILEKGIRDEINKNPDNYFLGKEGFNGITGKENFYVTKDKLVIFYEHYEIAPYAAGIPEFDFSLHIFENNYVYDKIK